MATDEGIDIRVPKPGLVTLRRLQREFLQLRWDAIEARGEQKSFSRSINTSVVTNVSTGTTTHPAQTPAVSGSSSHLPSYTRPNSPFTSSAFMFADAACCGLLSARRKFMNFGDGMISYNTSSLSVEYVRENKKNYRARRLAIAISLIYVWLFFALLAWWAWLNTATSLNSDWAVVPPYGSGSIHLVLCLLVITTYVLGYIFVPRNTTVGLREGSLPSLLPLVLQTDKKQFMSSYAWSSKYLNIVRSLSEILVDCWLDVKELSPGDRVTQEIANAAASVRCLVIFFSYEYLRSVNCTLEFLTAMRYRGRPQQTIILLEAIGDDAAGRQITGSALTAAEARAVAQIIAQAIPGVFVATSIDELLTMLDLHAVRSTTKDDTARVVEWWALHGTAQTRRAPSAVKVVPPLLRRQMKHYWSCICSCTRKARGDVAGGFALLSGDASRVSWYRPPDPASLAMLGVIFVQVILHIHMFAYCWGAISVIAAHNPAFAGSCIPDSTFMHVTSITPFAMVLLQYFVSMRPDTNNVHDEVLLPLMVAAHSSGFDDTLDMRRRRRSSTQAFSFKTIAFLRRLKDAQSASDEALDRVSPSAMRVMEENHSSFNVVFVVSRHPSPAFGRIAESMSAFLTLHACGLPSRVMPIDELPATAKRFTMYIFLMDSLQCAAEFYMRVHCVNTPVGPIVRAQSHEVNAWPTSQIVILVLASLLSRPPAVARQAVANAPPAAPSPRPSAPVSPRKVMTKTGSQRIPPPPLPESKASIKGEPAIGAATTSSTTGRAKNDVIICVTEAGPGLTLREALAPQASPPQTLGALRQGVGALEDANTDRRLEVLRRISAARRPSQTIAEVCTALPATGVIGRTAEPTSVAGNPSHSATVPPPLASEVDVTLSRPRNAALLQQQARGKWQRVLRMLVQELPNYQRRPVPPILTCVQTEPFSTPEGGLATHLRLALFEYLLLTTGPKQGIDSSSPYDSLSEAILDSVGRKVGSIIESGSRVADASSTASSKLLR